MMPVDPSSGGGALAGVRVVDLSRVLGGPYCTQMLADHGADVVKIEPPQGDETRGWGPPFADGTASYFLGVNRNKRGIALDLSRAEAQEIVFALLETADVLVENFRTGTLDRWGLGDAVLAERFPRLIRCRISGFGSDGPLGGLPGYDAVVQAMTGLMSVNGEPEGQGGGALRLGVPVVDLATGANAVIGILMALVERGRSGRGQFVDASLYDSGVALMHPHLPNHYLSGRTPVRTGNAHPNICPYDLFPTRTKPVFLAVGNDAQFRRFCAGIDRASMADDPRFASNATRLANRSALRDAIVAALSVHDGPALAERLMGDGVPCGAVLDVADVAVHPHTRHRGMVVDVDGVRGTGTPVRLSRTPATFRRAPPVFAADTRAVLREAGFDDARIDRWLRDGIAFAPALPPTDVARADRRASGPTAEHDRGGTAAAMVEPERTRDN